MLQEVFTIREGVKGDGDSGTDTPRVELAERNGIRLLGGRLGFHASNIELIQEELVSGHQKGGELARHDGCEGLKTTFSNGLQNSEPTRKFIKMGV